VKIKITVVFVRIAAQVKIGGKNQKRIFSKGWPRKTDVGRTPIVVASNNVNKQ
jgi:hypothetical protein